MNLKTHCKWLEIVIYSELYFSLFGVSDGK